MDPTDINSQEHEGDYITQLSNQAGNENVDHPPADEVTNQTDVSPPQVTENSKEMQSGTDTTKEMSSEDDKQSSRKTQNPEDVAKDIQMQKTDHDLYCPNCTHNITGTTKQFVKGQETFPYNNERFVFVIVFSFKFPFIYLPWLYNTTQEQVKKPLPREDQVKKPLPREEPAKDNKPEPLFSAEEQIKPIQPKPPLSEDTPAPKPDSSNTFPTVLPENILKKLLPNQVWPRLTTTSQRFLLVLILLLLSIILLRTLPYRPAPPPPSPSPSPHPAKHGSSSTQTNVQPSSGVNVQKSEDKGDNGGSDVPFPWLTNLLSNIYLPIILWLFLAILAVLWRSMLDNNGSQKEDSPNKEGNNNTSKVSSIINLLPPIKLDCLDILKSIVYGGLIESITSFGVVSSAAASGTSTLNVLALGLANLFSGLLIIIHNLYGLFKRPRYQSWNNDHMPELVSVDPYEELLGKRNRVILHCVVVLVSFIVFGVVPPLFYGFSYKITDKRAVIFVAASLICVITLSFAKAYAFGMDKLKTVAAYTGIAVGGSALSFIASQHARDVFAKFDFHKLASDYLKK